MIILWKKRIFSLVLLQTLRCAIMLMTVDTLATFLLENKNGRVPVAGAVWNDCKTSGKTGTTTTMFNQHEDRHLLKYYSRVVVWWCWKNPRHKLNVFSLSFSFLSSYVRRYVVHQSRQIFPLPSSSSKLVGGCSSHVQLKLN